MPKGPIFSTRDKVTPYEKEPIKAYFFFSSRALFPGHKNEILNLNSTSKNLETDFFIGWSYYSLGIFFSLLE
jgi:hypothetical protein